MWQTNIDSANCLSVVKVQMSLINILKSLQKTLNLTHCYLIYLNIYTLNWCITCLNSICF